MALTWGDWAFGEGSRLSQLMADWMSIDAFIVLSGARLHVFVLVWLVLDGCFCWSIDCGHTLCCAVVLLSYIRPTDDTP